MIDNCNCLIKSFWCEESFLYLYFEEFSVSSNSSSSHKTATKKTLNFFQWERAILRWTYPPFSGLKLEQNSCGGMKFHMKGGYFSSAEGKYCLTEANDFAWKALPPSPMTMILLAPPFNKVSPKHSNGMCNIPLCTHPFIYNNCSFSIFI